jgi:hypothetical protein
MTVKDLMEKLSEFDSDLEIEFEFEESLNEGDTWLLRFDKLMKLTYNEKESVLLNFRQKS